MQALKWTSRERLELTDIREPQIASPTEVKIQIALTGICGTDLSVFMGKEAGIPDVTRGHEAVGTVVEIGAGVSTCAVGDRVVIDPNQYCGLCLPCRRGHTHLCEGIAGKGLQIAGIQLDGTFAPYFVCDERYVFAVPEAMSLETAMLIEPLACVLHNFQVARVKPYDSVLVLGSGPMGLIAQMVSRRLAGRTVATEMNPFRLEAARRYSDAAYSPEELYKEVMNKHSERERFDVVIDTVGNQLETAEAHIKKGGRIVLFGIHSSYTYTFSPTHYLMNGIQIIGAGEYHMLFEQAIQFAASMPELGQLVTRQADLSQFREAVSECMGYDLETKERVPNRTLKTAFRF
ncbi:zinc-dependent alcohol dehydrogenase [Marinicrinis sediminis]|uniref:Zinc-binding dehydrogenase n=1 Tax=Marinicrinis sediminis TaxID=1652465 RepID=A0ABW5R828_9BACL